MRKLILLLILTCCISTSNAQKDQKIYTSPTWELKDINGNKHMFPENKNTVVLFWATWCPFCKKLMPHLQSILFQYGEELNVQVFAMDIFEDEDHNPMNSQKLLNNNGYDFILFPKAEKIAQLYGVRGTPTLFVFNTKGELIFNMKNVNLDKIKITDKDKNSKKASLLAPLWAAEIRKALVTKLNKIK